MNIEAALARIEAAIDRLDAVEPRLMAHLDASEARMKEIFTSLDKRITRELVSAEEFKPIKAIVWGGFITAIGLLSTGGFYAAIGALQ